MKTIKSQGSNGGVSSLPIFSANRSNTSQIDFRPRANPPPIKTIELMGINLHDEKELSREVEQSEVT